MLEGFEAEDTRLERDRNKQIFFFRQCWLLGEVVLGRARGGGGARAFGVMLKECVNVKFPP